MAERPKVNRYCPRCGSIAIDRQSPDWSCKEPDCGYSGAPRTFRNYAGKADRDQPHRMPNAAWRDFARDDR